MKPLTDEAHILFIEYMGAAAIASKLFYGSADAFGQGRSEARQWDAAATSYAAMADEIKSRLQEMGYEWESSPDVEWPELVTEREE